MYLIHFSYINIYNKQLMIELFNIFYLSEVEWKHNVMMQFMCEKLHKT